MLVEHPAQHVGIEIRDRDPACPAADEMDEHVDPPEPRLDGVDTACAASRSVSSPRTGIQASSASPALLGHPAQPVLVAADEREPRPVRGEPPDDRPAEGAGGTRDEDDGGRRQLASASPTTAACSACSRPGSAIRWPLLRIFVSR